MTENKEKEKGDDKIENVENFYGGDDQWYEIDDDYIDSIKKGDEEQEAEADAEETQDEE
ncbi:MAG: hypothetical protein SXQ77_07285 [Halobacteria archaeon]|nr:hypothetical protein [Halobacteria archaeon]